MRGLGSIAVWGASLAAACVPSAIVLAVDPPALPEALVRALDSDSLEDRERATAEIVDEGEPMARLAAVEAALRDPSLTAEQRERLHTAGLRLFAGTPRAAMGVSIRAVNVGEGPVTVDPSAPGFDAARVLVEGDVVRYADGLPIVTDTDLRCAIVSHDPGEEMTLGIVRSGEPMTVKLRLGRFSDLGQGRGIDENVLVGAWDQRAARSAPAAAAPLAGGLGAARWAEARERARAGRSQRSEPVVDPSSHEPVRSPLSRPPAATLTVGGQRGDPSARDEAIAMGRRRYPSVAEAQRAQQRMTDRSTLELVRAQMSQTAQQIGELERRLAIPGMTADQRRAASEQLEVLRMQRVRLVEFADALSRNIGR